MKYFIKLISLFLSSIFLISVQSTYGQAQFVNVQAIGSSPGHAVTSFSVECIVSPITSQYTIELQRFTNSNPNWVTIDTQQWNEYLYTVSSYRIYALEDNNPLTGSTGDDGINLYRFKSTYNGNVTTSYAAYGASFDYSNEISCSKYNDVYRKAGHNSYEEFQFRTLKDALNTTQSIEIDFHGSGTYSRWEVRHADLFNGNHNNCGTGDDHFDICLDDVIEWSNDNPNHEVITLFLDAKSGWDSSSGRSTSDFDYLLSSTFGNKLFTPSDLKGNFSTVRAAAQANNWPLMNDLKGKIICVVTGASENLGVTPGNPKLNQYVSERGSNAIAFIAPGIESSSQINNIPNFDNANHLQWVTYYNMDLDNIKNSNIQTTYLFGSNFISRVYEVPDDVVSAFNPIETTTDSDYIFGVNNAVHFFAMHRSGQTAFNYQKMDGSYGATNDLIISGGNLVCNNQYSNFTLSSSTLSGSYNWSVSNSNLSITSGQTSPLQR